MKGKGKNKTMKKKLLLFLALALAVVSACAISGCTKKDNLDGNLVPNNGVTDTDKNGTDSETDDIPELPEAVLTEDDKEIAMNIGGNDISKAELAFYLLNYKEVYGGTDSEVWESAAIKEIKTNAAIKSLAATNSVSLSEEVKKANVDDIIAQTINRYSEEEGSDYQTELKNLHLTDSLFRKIQEDMVLQAVLYNEAYRTEGGNNFNVNDSDILDYVHENYVRVKHILIKTVDLDDEQKAEARTRADKILSDARGGTSFEDLVNEYSEDGMDVETGYYFTQGEMVQEFENASFALDIDEISDIVESTYGYHIIKRYDMDDSYILSDETLRAAALDKICLENYIADLNETAESLTGEYSDNYEAVVAEILAEADNSAEADE